MLNNILNYFNKAIEENKIESDIKYLCEAIKEEGIPIQLKTRIVIFLCDTSFSKTIKEKKEVVDEFLNILEELKKFEYLKIRELMIKQNECFVETYFK